LWQKSEKVPLRALQLALFMVTLLYRRRRPVKQLPRGHCGKEGLGKARAIA
jgi:hypothetical protein